MADFETFICVDLRPFNPAQDDKGVQAYLERLGFQPGCVVFLNFFVDFLHRHEAIDDAPLGRMTVGQRGTPSEFSWTKRDLHALVQALRHRGISPLLGILASTRSDIWNGVEIEGDFRDILQTKRGGQTLWSGSINPLKRFADGRYYEDTLARDLTRVLEDYGFDGYVAGDGMLGLRGPRETLLDSDFSEDMVDQFKAHSKLELPSLSEYDARADYLVEHYYEDWVDFWVQRWGRHVDTICRALSERGRRMYAIDAWSRNPEEAISAFGIDYRLLHAQGLRGVFVQARETNKWRKHREGEYVREENSVYTFLAHKAHAPELPFYWAQATANRPEFWHSVLDLPHVLERETYGYVWTRHWRDQGFERIVDGLCVIWGNDLDESQWRWLTDRWKKAFASSHAYGKPVGALLVWNDMGVERRSVDNQVYGRRFAELLNSGVCLQASLHERDLAEVTGHAELAELPLVTFDPTLVRRWPAASERCFTVFDAAIEHQGSRYSWHEGVERLKRRAGLRSSSGRLMGFEDAQGDLVLSIENANNLFYEHITLTAPFDIAQVSVWPPRDWYMVPHSEQGNRVKLSVAPDASTQVTITRKRSG